MTTMMRGRIPSTTAGGRRGRRGRGGGGPTAADATTAKAGGEPPGKPQSRRGRTGMPPRDGGRAARGVRETIRARRSSLPSPPRNEGATTRACRDAKGAAVAVSLSTMTRHQSRTRKTTTAAFLDDDDDDEYALLLLPPFPRPRRRGRISIPTSSVRRIPPRAMMRRIREDRRRSRGTSSPAILRGRRSIRSRSRIRSHRRRRESIPVWWVAELLRPR